MNKNFELTVGKGWWLPVRVSILIFSISKWRPSCSFFIQALKTPRNSDRGYTDYYAGQLVSHYILAGDLINESKQIIPDTYLGGKVLVEKSLQSFSLSRCKPFNSDSSQENV
ncbi:MAG: hypothetical protein ACXAEU_06365 [Candidatus Hodarchaeales archaeon]